MYFFNDKMQLLKILKEKSINVYDKYVIPLSQDELCKLCKFSKSKINNYIKEFEKKELLIILHQNHSRYILTEKAIEILERVQTLEKDYYGFF